MKKLSFIVFALLLALCMAIPMAAPAMAADVETFPLCAGQNIPVGQVQVTNDETNITVTFMVEDPWKLVETHVAVATTPEDIPQKNGNPIPGQFPYTGNPVVIPLLDGPWDADDNLIIATHAVVQKVVQDGYTVFDCLVSGAGTDEVLYLAEDPLNPGYPVGYTGPFQPYSGTAVPSVACWEASVWPQITGADWISSADVVETPDLDTWRLFTRSFTLPTNAINISGSLTMNADNGEEAYLNGEFIGDGSPAIVYGDGTPGSYPPSGVQHGWSTIEGPWDVSLKLVAGNNNLWTMTRNYGWAGGVYANPTGLIYKLCYSYDVPPVYQTETAWGGTNPFPGKNWATYLTYSVKGWKLVETVTVPSTNWAGVYSSNVLASGDSYKFVASGTWAWTGGASETVRIADAEYAYRTDAAAEPVPPDNWTIGENTYASVLGFDVLVDNYQPYATPPVSTTEGNVYWGDYNSSHEYTYPYTGTDNKVHFNIYDNVYTDNYGVITVKIYHWE